MGSFHSHPHSGYPRLNKDEPLEKVNRFQYLLHYIYGILEPTLLRLADYLFNRYYQFEFSKPKKAKRIRNLIKILNNKNLPRGLVISTNAAKNVLEHVLTAEGPNGARLAVGPCVCQMALHKQKDPYIKDMVILYGADIYMHLKRGYKLIDLKTGKDLLDKFHEVGLIHSLDYCMQSEKWVFVICNCDSEICVLYRGDELFGDIIRRGPEIVQIDNSKCIGMEKCGNCINRCRFDANTVINGNVVFDPSKCKGCGLCVSTCLGQARSMTKRDYYQYEEIVPSSLLLKDKYK